MTNIFLKYRNTAGWGETNNGLQSHSLPFGSRRFAKLHQDLVFMSSLMPYQRFVVPAMRQQGMEKTPRWLYGVQLELGRWERDGCTFGGTAVRVPEPWGFSECLGRRFCSLLNTYESMLITLLRIYYSGVKPSCFWCLGIIRDLGMVGFTASGLDFVQTEKSRSKNFL